MKKSLLLISAVLMLSSTMSARQWNFSNWSSATISQIKAADDFWSNDEKGDGTTNVVPDKACVWNLKTSTSDACDADGNLLAGGEAIAELVGLKWNALAAKKIAIAFDYQITTDANKWGPYNGPAYLWMNGKTTAVHFTIPSVAPGTVIKIGVESHKTEPADARGVDLLVGGTKLEKNPSEYPTAFAEYTWTVPEDGEDPVDVDVQPSNGCHLYYINVMEGDEGFDASAVKVAYLYDGTYNGAKDADKNLVGWLANGGLDNDMIYAALTSYDVQTIDYSTVGLTSAELNDSLIKYDVVVLSEAVSSSNALAKGIYDIVNKVPMLNLKSFFYKSGVWGVGAGNNPSPKATTITVAEDYLDDALFANVEMDEGVITLYDGADPDAVNGNLVQGCTPAADGLFGTDEAIATVPSGTDASFTAIHTHGTRNMYMLIPLSSDNSNLLNENAMTIISNAVEILAKTKSSVQKAGKPNVEQQMANNETTVSISSSATNPTIYYSIDGGDYAIYSEPFVVTKDGTVVKAYAIAHGYDTSDTTEVTISVQAQAAAPRFASVDSEGFTTITLTAAEGTNIYFNFVGGENAATSQLYTEPIVLKEPATLTAFATGDGVLQSEAVSRDYSVGGIPAVKDTISHFTANEEAWFTNVKIYDYAMVEQELPTSNWAAKAAYYWGKSGWSYYSTTEVDHTEIVYAEDGETPLKSLIPGQEDQDSVKTVYKVDPTTVKYVYSTVETDWRLRSQGQAFTGETNVAASTGVGNAATGYYAETPFDEIGSPSKGKMTFGGKGSGESYTGSVESTVKFEGEFDVVTYLTNGASSAIGIELQKSTDGETWETVGALSSASTQRYYKKDRFHISATEPVYIRVAQVSGSSKGQLYDIYVIRTDGTTGIEAITANDEKSAKSQYVIDLMGRRAGAMVPGQMYLKDGKAVIVR